jgi:plastocyanin
VIVLLAARTASAGDLELEGAIAGGVKFTALSTRAGAATMRRFTLSAGSLALVLALLPSQTASAATKCPTGWVPFPSPNVTPLTGYRTVLTDVATLSPTDAWAVGHGQSSAGSRYFTFILHWDGTSWAIQPTPNLSTGDNTLNGVYAVAPDDVWAVGAYVLSGASWQSLTLHWDGVQWTNVTSPNPATDNNVLRDVSGSSSTNIWAVGYRSNGARTLAMRWDGQAWDIVASPNPGPGGNQNDLYAVRTLANNDARAVGYYTASGVTHALAARWNGNNWIVDSSVVEPSAGEQALRSVDASGADYVLTAGYYNQGSGYQTLAEQQTGSGWSLMQTANPAPGGNWLEGISVRSAADAWAVGGQYLPSSQGSSTLVEHWNGSAWSEIMSFVPSTRGSILDEVSASSATDAWAVGGYVRQVEGDSKSLIMRYAPCVVGISDSGFDVGNVSVPKGRTVTWHASMSNARAHTATDATGLNLFGSDDLEGGSSFAFTFNWAGTYGVVDADSGASSTVRVPISVRRTDTGARVTWGVQPPAADLVFDVQVKRPGTSSFVAWQTGVTTTTEPFDRDGSVGTYSFRTRVRDASSGETTGWSPAKKLTL